MTWYCMTRLKTDPSLKLTSCTVWDPYDEYLHRSLARP